MGIIATIKKIIGSEVTLSLTKAHNHERNGQIINPYGIDSKPVPGMKGLGVEVNGKEAGAITGVVNKKAKAKEGETRLYSSADTEIYLKDTGEIYIKSTASLIIEASDIQLGGDNQSFVTYEEFEKVMTEFKTAYMTHNHEGAVPTSPPLAQDSNLLDFKDAKSETVKTNG